MRTPQVRQTTWAKAYAASNHGPIVNPDSIRLALHGQRFVIEAEGFVWATAHVMVRSLFLAGHDLVIFDSTNVVRRRRDEWQSRSWRTRFVVMETPKEECLRRANALNDAEIVPVIKRMAAQWEPLGSDELLWHLRGGGLMSRPLSEERLADIRRFCGDVGEDGVAPSRFAWELLSEVDRLHDLILRADASDPGDFYAEAERLEEVNKE